MQKHVYDPACGTGGLLLATQTAGRGRKPKLTPAPVAQETPRRARPQLQIEVEDGHGVWYVDLPERDGGLRRMKLSDFLSQGGRHA